MRKWFLALALIVLPLAFAAPALAVPPTTEVTVFVDLTFDDTELCGFPITFVENGSFKVTTFYDRDGNPVKTILTNFNQRYTSTATANGKTLSTNYPLAVITYTDADTRVEVGLRNAYHVPGEGVVLLDAGRIIIDRATGEVVFEAGPHQFLNGSGDAFCSYFAS